MSQQQRHAPDQLLQDTPLDLGGDVAEQRAIFEEIMAAIPVPADVTTSSESLELSRLLGALDASDVLAFAIAAYAGARRAEIRHARVNDIDLKLGIVYLGADERGRKSRAAQRAVPLAKPLKIIVRRALLERGRPADSELLCPGSKPGGRNSGMLSFEALQVRADERWTAAGSSGSLRTSVVIRSRRGWTLPVYARSSHRS